MRSREQCSSELSDQIFWECHRVPADCLLLGMQNAKGYAVMLDMPEALVKSIVPGSMSFRFDDAIEANLRLTTLGHEVALRSQIDKHLRLKNIMALRTITMFGSCDDDIVPHG